MADHGRCRGCHLGAAERLVVHTPHGDGRMVAEQVHCLAGLAGRLPSDASRHDPTEGQLLPDEQTCLIGCGVELRASDMGDHPDEVETGLHRGTHIASYLLLGRVTGTRGGRQHSGTLEKQRLPVDAKHPVLEGNRAKADADLAGVVDLVGDHHIATQIVERLIAEAVGPPEFRGGYVESPLDPVLARCSRVGLLVFVPGHSGAEDHTAAVGGIEHAAHGESCTTRVRVEADRPEVADGDRPGLVDAHASPDASGVLAGRAGELRIVECAHER